MSLAQAPIFSVHFVPGARVLVFDFALGRDSELGSQSGSRVSLRATCHVPRDMAEHSLPVLLLSPPLPSRRNHDPGPTPRRRNRITVRGNAFLVHACVPLELHGDGVLHLISQTPRPSEPPAA